MKSDTTEIDVLEWMARLALELVGQAGLGWSFDPLTDDTPREYTAAVKQFLYVFQRYTDVST